MKYFASSGLSSAAAVIEALIPIMVTMQRADMTNSTLYDSVFVEPSNQQPQP
jgi:hypothetical protein